MDSELHFERGKHPALMLGFYTFISCILVVYSFRAVAADDYFSVFWTDVLYALLGFTIFKKMQDAHTKREMIAYVVGIALGSQVAMHGYKAYDEWKTEADTPALEQCVEDD